MAELHHAGDPQAVPQGSAGHPGGGEVDRTARRLLGRDQEAVSATGLDGKADPERTGQPGKPGAGGDYRRVVRPTGPPWPEQFHPATCLAHLVDGHRLVHEAAAFPDAVGEGGDEAAGIAEPLPMHGHDVPDLLGQQRFEVAGGRRAQHLGIDGLAGRPDLGELRQEGVEAGPGAIAGQERVGGAGRRGHAARRELVEGTESSTGQRHHRTHGGSPPCGRAVPDESGDEAGEPRIGDRRHVHR